MLEHDDLGRIDVIYDQNDARWVKCFCGNMCKVSILPHLKKEHADKWEEWRMDFVRLKNAGWSYKRIMWKYRAIFSWSVIDREIRRIIDEGKATVHVHEKLKAKEWSPSLELEKTTVWDFNKRGDWAVHQDDYRGNWPPQVPRNLILNYTRENDLVLDPFVGGGTTLIEAYLLNRRSIGVDISHNAVRLCKEKMRLMENQKTINKPLSRDCRPLVIKGDAYTILRRLRKRGFEEKVDLVCAHPPYLDSITYTNRSSDLSNLHDTGKYCERIGDIGREILLLLRKKGICAFLVGDIRKDHDIVPLGFKVMNQLLDEGFAIRDIIVKLQHKDKSTEFYRNKESPRYLLQHEYLMIFDK